MLNKKSPLSLRDCPHCGANLVDGEVSEPVRKFCEPGAFHSRLMRLRDPETGFFKHWECPNCNQILPEPTENNEKKLP